MESIIVDRSPVSMYTIVQFLADVPVAALKIFDINLRQSYYTLDIIRKSLEMANILKINDEEIIVVGNLLGIDAGAGYVLQEFIDRYN